MIAFGGALVTVLGGLAVVAGITWFGWWRTLWNEWLTSVDHKRIGIMYVTLALIMLMRGFIDALMMRSQQAVALNSDGYLPPEHFDQIFSWRNRYCIRSCFHKGQTGKFRTVKNR